MYEEENIESNFLKRKKDNPFRTPDHYFESMEDRVMAGIKHQEKTKSTTSKIIQFLKPALGLAASFTIVYLLVYYPINHFLPKSMVKNEISDTIVPNMTDAYSFSFALIDENTIINTIFSDDENNSNQLNDDDLLAYLSSGWNDLDIYSEIQN